MKKFIASFLLFITWQLMAADHDSFINEVKEQTQLDCQAHFSLPDGDRHGQYQIVRFGDSLFARYRHFQTRDLLQTDDVLVKRYAGDELDELNRDGLLDRLLQAADVSRSSLTEVTYYGIDETSPGFFEMNVYRLTGALGVGLRNLARWHQPEIESFARCQ